MQVAVQRWLEIVLAMALAAAVSPARAARPVELMLLAPPMAANAEVDQRAAKKKQMMKRMSYPPARSLVKQFQSLDCPHLAVSPPSIGTSAPVMKDASSDNR